MGEGLALDARALRRGEVDPVGLLERTLADLDRWEPHLRATTHLLADRAHHVALERGAELARGIDRGPLHGIPVAVKDVIDIAGEPTTAGSRLLAGSRAQRDAPVVAALEAAGAVIVAKTNTHEFAFGALTPPTRNPYGWEHMPGGSSGGSAAIVGAGVVDVAIGSDTAGSIREPAALCGAVGLKPTTGTFDLSGVVPLSWSLDTVGPIAATPQDAELTLMAMAGARLPGVAIRQVPRTLPGTRLVVWAELEERMEAPVRSVYEAALSALRDAGACLTTRSLGEPDEAVAAAIVLLGAEALSYHRVWLEQRRDEYTPDVLGYLDLAATFGAGDLVDAQRLRGAVRSRLDRELATHDVLLTPAQLVLPPLVSADEVRFDDGRAAPRDLSLIRPLAAANVTGHPAVSAPVGHDPATGFPVSLQLVGPHGSDASLCGLAAACQAATGFVRALPAPRVLAG